MGGAQKNNDVNSKCQFPETRQWKHQHYSGKKIIALHRRLHRHTTNSRNCFKKGEKREKKLKEERASGNRLDEQNPYVQHVEVCYLLFQ